MTTTVNVSSVIMPAGDYYVGDPCYAFSHTTNRWDEWLNDAGINNDPFPRYMLAESNGAPVLGIGTAYGDGCFRGSDGFEYGVDAGLIGVVPVAAADTDNALYAMNKTTFDKPFTCSYDEGTITIGHIVIETGDDGYDFYYDEDEDGEY